MIYRLLADLIARRVVARPDVVLGVVEGAVADEVDRADHEVPRAGLEQRPQRVFDRIELAIGAGLSFGTFFIFLERASDGTGIWPLIGMRAASITLVAIIALSLRRSLRPPSGTIGAIAGSGILDVGANVFYLLATRFGLLTLVAVLTSMYPAVTVLLARIFLKERMMKVQLVGLTLAGAAIAMIVAG